MRPAPRVSKSARDPSAHAPATDWRDSRKLPAAHIRLPPAAVSVHPDTDPSWLPRLRHRESNAASAVATAAFLPAPYPGHGWPASHEIPLSALTRAFLDSR